MEKRDEPKKLIGISGKMGSGKDTVGDIIRILTSGVLVSNDTVEHTIKISTNITGWGSPWIIKKMAGKLKFVASILSGVPMHLFEDQEFKKQKMDPEWGDITYREFLQKIGTDALRDKVHEEIWANSLFVDQNDDSQWIVTDVRFPNEAVAIKKRDGILIRVNTTRECVVSDHPSETSLDNYEDFDYVIDNSGTISELTGNIREILVKEGIL